MELSLNISNGNDQDTWRLFDTANMPHTSDFMYDMSLIREGIIVDSVEGKITVNSIQSTTKDRGVGDNVYVWAYNSVRGLWLLIGNFRIEEGGIIPIIGMFLGPPRQFNPKHNTSTFIDK